MRDANSKNTFLRQYEEITRCWRNIGQTMWQNIFENIEVKKSNEVSGT
jgi:hypothetical protein